MFSPRPRRDLGAALAVAVVLCAPGCGRTVPEPVIDTVTPDFAFNQESTQIRIEGEGLWPRVVVDASRRDGLSSDEAHEVRLWPRGATLGDTGVPEDGYGLVGIAQDGPDGITAVVPPGLPVGTYDLSLTTALGATTTAVGAFRIVDTRADALDLELSQVSYEIFDEASITVRLVDPFGEPVAQPRAVSVQLLSDAGGLVDVTFDGRDLEGVTTLSTGYGVQGDLGDDGEAVVGLTVGTPGTYTVVAAPVAPDDAIATDDVRVQWRPGELVSTRIELPDDDFVATAGTEFPVVLELVDEFGTLLEDATTTVILRDACFSWLGEFEVTGRAIALVETRTATGEPGCDTNRIEVAQGPSGSSDPFEVLPGEAAGFDLEISPPVLTAGSILNTFVTPVDAWGNAADWQGAFSVVQDSVDGVQSANCAGQGTFYCGVRVIRAGTGITLTVADDTGLTGTSAAYTVVADVPDRVTLEVPSTWVAGEPQDVWVQVLDTWDNPLPGGQLSTEPLVFGLPDPDDACTFVEVAPDGRQRWACTLTSAGTGQVLTVDGPDLSSTAEAAGLQVVNGPLATLDLDAPPTAEAGQPVSLAVTARDAWGNPYEVQDDPVLTLSASEGTVSPTTLTLGPDGTVTADVTLFRAGESRRLVATGTGGVVGETGPITVDAGPASSLSVSIAAAWVWLSEATQVTVQAVDAWGNRALADGSVTVSSASGSALPLDVPLVNGTGTAPVTWSSADASDQLVATGLGLTGTSASVVVVRECVDGPSPSLAFSGQPYDVTCFDPVSGQGQVSLSLTGSTAAPGHNLVAFGARIDDDASTGSSPNINLDLASTGRKSVSAVVVQDDGCGAEIDGEAWVGIDDGTPTGPISVAPSATTLDLEGGDPTTTVVLSGVQTCRQTIASGQALRVRTDRGELVGPVPSGEGLTVTTNTLGQAVLELDAGVEVEGGLATIVVASADGVASGQGSVLLQGDVQLPQVWWQDPKGELTDPTDVVVLRMSEPMDPASVGPGAFTVVGPVVLTADDAILSPDGTEIEVWLSGTATPAPAVPWQLQVAPVLTDLAGNPLQGTWSGAEAPYTGAFGVDAAVDAVGSCVRSVEAFSPDGDDGLGLQADHVTLNFSSATIPAWWVVSVEDGLGALVRREYLVPTGAAGSWAWDGRDATGRVVPTGSYTLRVDAEGNLGNLGGACSRSVDVEQWQVP